MSTSTNRMTHTAEAPNKSPSTVSPDKQQLRQRLLEMILKREAERRAPPRAAG
jgi:hypothetical protein